MRSNLFTQLALDTREADHNIESLLLKRWSPRSFTGETIAHEQLLRIFEAGRWAPSTYNEQEWRFLYATNDGNENWNMFYDLLTPDNQVWCKNAAVLVAIAGSTLLSMNNKPNEVHSFDCGAAFQNMALQASSMNIVCHGMAGFDRNKAEQVLKLPQDFCIEAMFALGLPAPKEQLPEKLQKLENPSDRRPLSESVREGAFDFQV